ncbi:MAG: nuclear transport factor 2 family protein [Devosia sp.]
MSLDVPAPVAAFRDRVNAGDTNGVLELFPPDGVVIDWGRRFVGHAAIGGWSDKELVGAHGTLTITAIVSADARTVVADTQWTSSFFTGPGRFTFTLEGDLIRQMEIAGE